MTEQTTAMTASTPNLTCEQQIVLSYFRCLLDFRIETGIPLFAAIADARGEGFVWNRPSHTNSPSRNSDDTESDSESSRPQQDQESESEQTQVDSAPKIKKDRDVNRIEIPLEMIPRQSIESECQLNIADLERSVLPLAGRLACLADDPETREALGLHDEQQLFSWIAILLYLHEKDALLGATYRSLMLSDENLRDKVTAARKQILDRMRNWSRHIHSSAELFTDDTPNAQALQNHHVRQTLLFALVNLVHAHSGRKINQPKIGDVPAFQTMMSMLTRAPETEPLDPCRSLVLGLIFCIHQELSQLLSHRIHVSLSSKINERAVDEHTYTTFRRTERISTDLLILKYSASEDGTSRAKKEPQKTQRIEVPDRPHIRFYAPVLRLALKRIERSTGEVECGDIATSFSDFSRFRFAAQMLSSLTHRKYTAQPRKALADAVTMVLPKDRHCADGIERAIAVYQLCPGPEKWGQSHDHKLRRLLDRFFQSDAPKLVRRVQRLSAQEVTHSLKEILLISEAIPLYHSRCALDVKREQLEADPYDAGVSLWLVLIRKTLLIENSPNYSRQFGGCLPLYSILNSSLQKLFFIDPLRALNKLVPCLCKMCGWHPIQFSTASDNTRDKIKADLRDAADHHRTKLYKQPLGRNSSGAGLEEEAEFWEMLWEESSSLAHSLIEHTSSVVRTPTISEEKLIGFFTQTYRGNDEAKRLWPQEEWEYLAAQVAKVSEPYSCIYQSVKEYCGERERKLPHDTPSLRKLYALLLPHEKEIRETLENAVRQCCHTDPSRGAFGVDIVG